MKQTNDGIHPNPKKRPGLVFGAVLLGLAVIAAACSSDTSTSQAATTTDPTVATTEPATTTSTSVSTSTSTSTTTSDEMEAFFDEVEASGFGGVISVRDGSDITTRAYGFADRENDIPMDAETVFDIASITKQFTAAAILRLEMDGRLSVDDTLGDHVPGLPDDKAAITLHHLLTHTAGLPAGLGLDDEPIGRSDYLALVGETPLLSEPGDRFEYSNVGYSLLTAVIEFETGESYEEYLRTALFEPAGMLDTGYVLPDWDGHTIAVGYYNPSTPPGFRRPNHVGDRFGRPNEQTWDVDGPYWHLHGNGGLLSTAADMLRWDEALIGEDILDTPAKSKYFAPHVPEGPDGLTPYGYGWQIVPTPMGTPLIYHNGSNAIFYADFLRFVDQDVAIFVATNSLQDDAFDLAFEMANLVLDGELSVMFESDDDGDGASEIDSHIDTAAIACGFDDLSIDSLPDHPEIETVPDSPAGRTATIFLDLLAGGDATARLDFVADHATEELVGDDPTTIADGIKDLQAVFTEYEMVRILEQDNHRFHLLMQGPGDDLLFSVGFDETDPERLACIAVST